MKTEEPQNIRICCKVNRTTLLRIERLARAKGITTQQATTDLLEAQFEYLDNFLSRSHLDAVHKRRQSQRVNDIDIDT